MPKADSAHGTPTGQAAKTTSLWTLTRGRTRAPDLTGPKPSAPHLAAPELIALYLTALGLIVAALVVEIGTWRRRRTNAAPTERAVRQPNTVTKETS